MSDFPSIQSINEIRREKGLSPVRDAVYVDRFIIPITGQEVSDILHANFELTNVSTSGYQGFDYTAIADAINKRMGVK